MRHLPRPGFTIISAERAELSPAENAKRHQELVASIKEAGLSRSYEECTGVYEGVKEKSVKLYQGHEILAATLAAKFGQDAILQVDGNRRATLLKIIPDEGHVVPKTEAIVSGYWGIAPNDYAGDRTVIGSDVYRVEWLGEKAA